MEVKEKKLTRRQLEARYRQAMSFLDYNYAYFLTEVIRIGRPKWTTALPTAAVGLLPKKDLLGKEKEGEYDLLFLFNPGFASRLSIEEFAFVLAHEAFHVVLNHLKVSSQYYDMDRRKELADKYKRHERLDKAELKDWITFQQIEAKLNIAMDCVINDYLVNNGLEMFKIENPEKPGEMIAGGCTGQKYIGESAAYMTVRDVYERLPEQPSGKRQEQGEGEGQGQPGYGDGRGNQAMDDHSWIFDPDAAEKMSDAIDKINDEIEKGNGRIPADVQDKKDEEETGTTKGQDKLSQSMRAGTEDGNIREFQEQLGVEMAWVKLLKEVDPDMFKEPGIGPPPQASWHARRRKLYARELKDINLPVYRDNRRKEQKSRYKPAIVLALDYSGSIGPTDADRFATLAKSIPTERIKVFACTFTTQYREFDLENPHGGGSGGTDFDAIADFIDDKVKPEPVGKGDYPKAVIVITDGHAPFSRRPEGKDADSWLWLLSPDDGGYCNYDASMNIGRRAPLDDYIA